MRRYTGTVAVWGSGVISTCVQFDIPEAWLESMLRKGVLLFIDREYDAYGAGILAIVRDLQVIRAGPWSSEDVQVKVVQVNPLESQGQSQVLELEEEEEEEGDCGKDDGDGISRARRPAD
ncbi:hypothetical protein AK812_SmicGene11860 [Symbiodinium microadriaticum]|uniref:Uncharacterized protein n=1 Tax=Symbiodinium microadriaticum TaxID=2951 RepID=A0A1Q9EC85_SYMMI|nr:hypothetical protein AK812_SmicGene11860 [Symbiodinium microadriaticum]